MSNQCEGKTKSGSRCTKKTRHDSKRCHFHRDTLVTEQPKQITVVISKGSKGKKNKQVLAEPSSAKIDCCVCMEEMPESDKLDCGHPLCKSCIGNLRNDKCPLCRCHIKAKHITSQLKSLMREKFEADRIQRILGN